MKLVDVYKHPHGAQITYVLLKERHPSTNISHKRDPSFTEHQAYMDKLPYQNWYIIDVNGGGVGALYASTLNEIGIFILQQHQRKGYARHAIAMFMATHSPLGAVPGLRNARWLANINPKNEGSIRLFSKLGFTHLQSTYAL